MLEGRVANDIFYRDIVAPAIIGSEIDNTLNELRQFGSIDRSSIANVLDAHNHLMSTLNRITGQNKRSLASKYLHFHVPELIYIYDSVANAALIRINPKYHVRSKVSSDFDAAYAAFAFRLLDLQEGIEATYGERLTPRQLDRLLWGIAANKKLPIAIHN